jgi:hypothetical protein
MTRERSLTIRLRYAERETERRSLTLWQMHSDVVNEVKTAVRLGFTVEAIPDGPNLRFVAVRRVPA